MAKESTNGLIETMEEWFKKAPALPTGGKEGLVKITPWIALIFGVLGVLGGIAGLGILSVFSPFAVFGGARSVSNYGLGMVSVVIGLAGSVFLLAAYPGTKARKMTGWSMLFWSSVLDVVSSVVALSIVPAIIWGIISFYLLFQIKSYYK